MSTARKGGYWASDYGGDRRILRVMIRLGAFLTFFLAWEILGRSGVFFAIVPATETLRTLWDSLASGELWGPILGTLRAASLGFALACIVGLTVGSLIGISRGARAALDPLLNAGQSTPMVMLVPVLGIYVGLGLRGKVILIFLFVVFVIAVNTNAGIANTPSALMETARAFGVQGIALYTKVIFPNALPAIATGLRLGVGRAVQGALVADLLLFVENLGESLIRAGSTFDMPKLLGVTLCVVILGSAAMAGTRYLERRALKWLYIS